MGAEYAAPGGFYQAPLTVTDKIYRDTAHPSRLVLPFTTRTAGERE
ncbi:hypothetical protein GCM10010420_55400 [Streptomyces glaucosporus]|uniref:Uncharacterized protein n=1 Tax=Streptomyces glaucosporus TaxID=284044 RepID=A0ABN3IZ02_9ACTN